MNRPNRGYFSVRWRNPGHWDVYDDGRRLFCIRGGAPDLLDHFYIRDEREGGAAVNIENTRFKTVDAAMAWICAELMCEKEGS